MYQFDFLRENDALHIISKIKNYNYVSFDIFDTLLKRDVLCPTDVFSLVGKLFHDATFCRKRVDTERDLRNNCGTEEITLDDIYDKLGKEYLPYKDAELDLEENLLIRNPSLYPVYEYCKENNKKIIITSDMYLPEDFLKKILRKNGIDFDFCFVSSAYGVKKVTGNLFKKLLEEMAVPAKAIIHIGDSVRGDCMGARKAGIKGILIPKVINRSHWVNLKASKQRKTFNSFINNHLNLKKTVYHQFGYVNFGPVLYGFIQWLHTHVRNKKIFFFARDGFVVKKIYDALYPDSRTDYIYLSRRALSVPLLWKHSDWNSFHNYITITRFFTLETLLERLGLNAELYSKIAHDFKLSLSTEFTEKTFLADRRLKAFYEYIKEDIVRNSREEFRCLEAYFREKSFQGNIAVMDIGWNGSMQRHLVELMKLLNINVKIDGYYFGVRQKLEDSQVHGYLYAPSNMELEPEISYMQGFFESLFLSTEGSTKRYTVYDKVPEPILQEPEYDETDTEYKAFQHVQQGAFQFCLDYDKSPASRLHSYTAEEYATALLRFGINPSLSEVSFFGDFRFYDTNIVRLAKPKSMGYYALHPKQFMQDLSYSPWKAGFIKRCFKVKEPYAYLYMLFKSKWR